MNHVVLTVADFEQNGFVALAQWSGLSEEAARSFIAEQDAAVSDDAEPDSDTAPFAFILDLMTPNGDCVDNGKRMLPTQVAMSLAPEQVRLWLEERPDPDSAMYRRVPELGGRP
ncbi:hypothetical protein LB553_00830 [Mesorhizobium sp. CA8]|uniref:hypothetical protein n=1 Tax=Mesorhizobium sp. CA8 TaxID=2876637 RepID=UPI001CCA554D|nr:hypothetical protein [Mesorhizobium sp. CA8]MBZ9759431.1 hypothetical protein [Mesorhizobium sp. CA8]